MLSSFDIILLFPLLGRLVRWKSGYSILFWCSRFKVQNPLRRLIWLIYITPDANGFQIARRSPNSWIQKRDRVSPERNLPDRKKRLVEVGWVHVPPSALQQSSVDTKEAFMMSKYNCSLLTFERIIFSFLYLQCRHRLPRFPMCLRCLLRNGSPEGPCSSWARMSLFLSALKRPLYRESDKNRPNHSILHRYIDLLMGNSIIWYVRYECFCRTWLSLIKHSDPTYSLVLNRSRGATIKHNPDFPLISFL